MQYIRLPWGILSLLGMLVAQPLTGTYTITGTSNFSANQFATIQEAFDSLNQRGAQGTLIITLPPGTFWDPASEPSVITLAGYPCIQCDVTLELDTAVTLAKSPAGTAGNRFVFRFGGNTQSTLTSVNTPGQLTNFALDGNDKFTIQSTTVGGGTTTGAIGIVSTTSAPLVVNGFHIRNLRIAGLNRSNTFSGIYLGPDTSLTFGSLQAGSSVSGLNIWLNKIDSVSRPIHVRGARSIVQNVQAFANLIGTGSDASWAVANNIGGIHILGATNVTINQNVVTGAVSGNNYRIAGIRLDTCENFNVYRNHIYKIRYTGTSGWGEYGIAAILPASFLGPVTNRITDNMIADIVGDAWASTVGTGFVCGIFLNASATNANARTILAHNSINLYGNNPSTYAGGGSAAIGIGSSVTGGVTIEGNILQNTLRASQASGKLAYGIVFFATSALSAVICNYNAYYVQASGADNHIGRIGGTNFTTFSAWQASSLSPEANGIGLFTPAPFLSNTDLHLSSTTPTLLINAGNPAYNGTSDYDGHTRPLPNPGPGPNGDPGSVPDIGADEVDGTPLICPSSIAAPNVVTSTPPNAGSDYLWGTTISLDTTGTNSPTASGALQVIYSLDGGLTWTAGPTVPSFPTNFTLPGLTPPNYTGTIHIAIRATQIPSCPSLAPDTSDTYLALNLTDAPGNRQATAIPFTLTDQGNGTWTATLTGNTADPGFSNEYQNTRGGSPARDMFFTVTLPTCFDSIRVTTCISPTNYDTRIHLINLTLPDTIINDDHGSAGACSGAPYSNPNYLSTILAQGVVPSFPIGPINWTTSSIDIINLRPDSMRLAQGDVLLLIVEGYNGSENGPFGVSITGYVGSKPAPNLGSDQIVCISQGTLTLNATTPGAAQYEWEVNGSTVSGANSATYALPLSVGTHQVKARAIFPNPNGAPCAPDTTESAAITITVSPEPQASIQVGSTTYNSGDTYVLSGSGSSVAETFTASSSVSGNSYTWELYNPGNTSSPDATGTGGTFNHTFTSAGLHTLILFSQNGICEDRDTLYVDVTLTTGLRSEAGAFQVFPNPSQGSFTVVAPAAGRYDLRILDMTGKLVYAGEFEGVRKDLRLSLPAGSYQLFLVGEGRKGVIRLLITE